MTTRQIGAEFTTTTTTSPTDLIEILTHDSVLNQWVPKNIAVQNFLSNIDSLTPQEVVFGGVTGELAQDASFAYDNTNKILSVNGSLSLQEENTTVDKLIFYVTHSGHIDATETFITNAHQSGSFTYTFPDAATDAEIVLTEGGTQIINGEKVFANDLTVSGGELVIDTAGRGLQIAGGSNARIGTTTLVNGRVDVPNTTITSATRIIYNRVGLNTSTALGELNVEKLIGEKFVITSLIPTSPGSPQTGDQSTINWQLIEEV